MSTNLIYLLLVFYAVILIASAFEGNWMRCLYWFGAMLIVIATMKIK